MGTNQAKKIRSEIDRQFRKYLMRRRPCLVRNERLTGEVTHNILRVTIILGSLRSITPSLCVTVIIRRTEMSDFYLIFRIRTLTSASSYFSLSYFTAFQTYQIIPAEFIVFAFLHQHQL